MKKTFTSLFALLIASCAISQITHTVNSGNFYYDPEVLTITVGDDVNWINDAGFHNVNADINTLTGASYGNPESFISSPTNGSDLYTHTFTIAGTYSYDCSVGSHAANGMVGTIIVEQGTSNVNETVQEKLNRTFHVFQSGFSNSIYVQFDAAKNSNNSRIQITGLDGKEILNLNLNIEQGKNAENITLNKIPCTGIYIVNLFYEGNFVTKKISIQ